MLDHGSILFHILHENKFRRPVRHMIQFKHSKSSAPLNILISYFFYCCEQIPGINKLKQEGFVSVHGFWVFYCIMVKRHGEKEYFSNGSNWSLYESRQVSRMCRAEPVKCIRPISSNGTQKIGSKLCRC